MFIRNLACSLQIAGNSSKFRVTISPTFLDPLLLICSVSLPISALNLFTPFFNLHSDAGFVLLLPLDLLEYFAIL